jgi:hypothetical protein
MARRQENYTRRSRVREWPVVVPLVLALLAAGEVLLGSDFGILPNRTADTLGCIAILGNYFWQ